MKPMKWKQSPATSVKQAIAVQEIIIMSKFRAEKMAGEIQREVTRLIRDEIKDPRINGSSISITRVDVSHDASHARVYISIMGSEEDAAQAMKILRRASGFLRSGIARQLKVKNAPELELRHDKSIEQGIKINAILAEVIEEESDLEKSPEGEAE